MKNVRRILSAFGLDFLFGVILFFLAVYAIEEYSLGEFFHVESAVFGVLSFWGIGYIGEVFVNLFMFIRNRKMSAPADQKEA